MIEALESSRDPSEDIIHPIGSIWYNLSEGKVWIKTHDKWELVPDGYVYGINLKDIKNESS